MNDNSNQERGRSSHPGRGRGRPPGRGASSRLPTWPAALQVQADWDVIPMDELCSGSHFGNQQEMIDFLLGDRCRNYVENIQRNLSLKLTLYSMECTELNLFHLLISTAFDSLLEYTNESLNEKRLLPLSYGDFRSFIGTLLLSSVFNTSIENAWTLMGSCTSNKHMPRERFVQILTNLHGYDMRHHIINTSNSWWIDQQNTLDHLHALGEKNYERSIDFF
jgi:hypothetical protein